MATADTVEALLAAGTCAIAACGFDGASVRQICSDAKASPNAVQYHFGGKLGLLRAILERFCERQMEPPARLLERESEDVGAFRTQLRMFSEETLRRFLEAPGPVRVAFTELEDGFARLSDDDMARRFQANSAVLADFFARGKQRGWVASDMDEAIVAGGLIERLWTQIRYRSTFLKIHGTTITDPTYRAHWLTNVLALVFRGLGCAETDDAKRPGN